MNTNYVITCCSTADMPADFFKNRNVPFVCFHFKLRGEDFMDDIGQSLPFSEFYDRMRQGDMTSTSQVNPDEYIAFWEPFLKEGKDILHVTLSSGISGTYNSAVIARDELFSRYPDRKLLVVDSLQASGGYGLIMELLADKRDEGMDIDGLCNWITEYRHHILGWFTTADLSYLIRGGRISRAAGIIGSVMNICPLMEVAASGALAVREKIRTKKKAHQALLKKMQEHVPSDYAGKCIIGHADCAADAENLRAMIETAFPGMAGKVQVSMIGTTIGSHTGPGLVALFFEGDAKGL